MNEEQTKTPRPGTLQNYLVPLAIVIGFGLIAGAIYLSGAKLGTSPERETETAQTNKGTEEVSSLERLRPIGKEDHVKGSREAMVKIIEYSDFECPFCKRFHDTMNAVMDRYGESGEVAWVYRHFPLEQLHPVKAKAVSVASECAAKQGGDDSFWQFTDRYFELTETNNRTEIEVVIPQIVREIGLDETAFQTCFESGEYDQRIQSDMENAVATGGRGTPWSILVAPNGKTFPINGAQPFETVVQLIELSKQE